MLDVFGPMECFSKAPQFQMVTVAEKRGEIASSQGPKTIADYSFDDCPPLDWILGWPFLSFFHQSFQ